MQIKSQKIAANTALNKIDLSRLKTADFKIKAKNVIFAIDVSGSMFTELPKMRQQLKNKIPSLIQPEDTISIIWFSGKDQSGILQEGVKVNNLSDLQKLNDSIDRFLRPMGLTAFLPPLELTEKVINNLKGNNNEFSFIFLSDGYNNDSLWTKVIEKVESLEPQVAAATFIEYGYYADSNALTEMAEKIGGEKIFSKDFDAYEHSFDKIINKEVDKKISVDISELKSKLRFQFFFTFDEKNESINTYSCVGEKEAILVPENVTELYFISRYKVDSTDSNLGDTAKLVAAYLLADRLKYNAVEDFLVNIGDLDLLNEFSGAFGKEKLNELKNHIKDYAFIPNLLHKNGKAENYKIDPKVFCIMDLIEILQSGDNKFYPFNKNFNYNKISAKRSQKIELTDFAKEQLQHATTVKEIQKITESIEAAEFIYPENIENIGFSFNELVWNQDRANLSVRIRLEGKVKLPKNNFGLTEVDSFIYRSFTLIKDGILNVTEIPVSLDEKTHEILLEKRFLLTSIDNNLRLLNISSLPVINRSMTVNVSAKKLAKLEFDLISVQSGYKYIKNIKSIYSQKTNEISAAKYSAEAAAWLKEIGVDDYNGFSPKTETVESEDFYMAPHLEVKIQNLSSVPAIKKVFEKIDALIKSKEDSSIKVKELTDSESLLKSEMDLINEQIYLNKFSYETRDDSPIVLESVNEIEKEYNNKRKELLLEMAKIKFGIILSRTWFTEFSSLEENELKEVSFKGMNKPLKVKFDFLDRKINL